MINAHGQALVNLQTISGTNPNRMHEFWETLITHIQPLEILGKLKEINGYVRSTLGKFPGIRSDLVRLDDNWQEWEFHEVIEALRKWTERNPVQNERRGEYINPKEKIKTYMARQEGPPQATCVYCNQEDHKGIVCEKFKDMKDRQKILSEKQLCFNCVKRGHRASECKSRKYCNCKRKHHTSICDKRTQNDQLMCSTTWSPIVFSVVIVLVNGVKCRALLDTGAGGSYVSSKLIENIDVRPIRRE